MTLASASFKRDSVFYEPIVEAIQSRYIRDLQEMQFAKAVKVYRVLTKQFKVKTPALHEASLIKLRGHNRMTASDTVTLIDGYLTYKRYGEVDID